MISGMAFSQVIIGDQTGTAGNKNAVLIEFAAGQNKGIILPYVRTVQAAADLTPGTILVDASDATKAKVKYYKDTNTWVDLSSGNEADLTKFITSNSPLTRVNVMDSQPTSATVTEVATAKAIIGADASTAKGVLVLESTSKVMVLPQVEDTNDVTDPAPGMMVYINKAGAKRLAVFNGSKWTYWKP